MKSLTNQELQKLIDKMQTRIGLIRYPELLETTQRFLQLVSHFLRNHTVEDFEWDYLTNKFQIAKKTGIWELRQIMTENNEIVKKPADLE